jgi:hypothetical protein
VSTLLIGGPIVEYTVDGEHDHSRPPNVIVGDGATGTGTGDRVGTPSSLHHFFSWIRITDEELEPDSEVMMDGARVWEVHCERELKCLAVS